MIELSIKLFFALCIAILFVFTYYKKQNFVIYFLFIIIIFFPELGHGFTSFNGSFFFNQNALNFANFKIIDLLVFLIFLCSIFKKSDEAFNNSPINLPIKFLSFYIIVLLGVDYINHEYFDFGSIRRQLSFVLLYFSLTKILNSKNIIYFNKVLASMFILKCLINLSQFIFGYGIDSFRGKATIFWDSGLIYGLGIFCICLFSLIINRNFILKRRYAILSFLIVLSMLLFAWRRNIWLSLLIGFLIVIQNARLMNKIISFYSLTLAFLIFLLSINIFPNSALSKYTKSMNFFNEDTFYDRSNQVHLENVLGYYTLLGDNPQIWFFGRRGVLDEDYKNINKWEEYNLGTPHNAIFAKIFNEGIFSFILYIWIHISFISFCLKRKKEIPYTYNVWITGIIGFMVSHFLLTLLFIPPETTFKGSFFIIFFMLTCINLINTIGNSDRGLIE